MKDGIKASKAVACSSCAVKLFWFFLYTGESAVRRRIVPCVAYNRRSIFFRLAKCPNVPSQIKQSKCTGTLLGQELALQIPKQGRTATRNRMITRGQQRSQRWARVCRWTSGPVPAHPGDGPAGSGRSCRHLTPIEPNRVPAGRRRESPLRTKAPA